MTEKDNRIISDIRITMKDGGLAIHAKDENHDHEVVLQEWAQVQVRIDDSNCVVIANVTSGTGLPKWETEERDDS